MAALERCADAIRMWFIVQRNGGMMWEALNIIMATAPVYDVNDNNVLERLVPRSHTATGTGGDYTEYELRVITARFSASRNLEPQSIVNLSADQRRCMIAELEAAMIDFPTKVVDGETVPAYTDKPTSLPVTTVSGLVRNNETGKLKLTSAQFLVSYSS